MPRINGPFMECLRKHKTKLQVLRFQSATEGARERAIAHCSLRIHMKHRDARCCERNGYDISLFSNRAFVFELRIRYDLVLRLKILRDGLSHFGIFGETGQLSSQITTSAGCPTRVLSCRRVCTLVYIIRTFVEWCRCLALICGRVCTRVYSRLRLHGFRPSKQWVSSAGGV